MRIANQPFMQQPVRNIKAVKFHEKTQTDKVTGTSKISQKEEMKAFKKDFYKELSKITTHNTVSNMAVNVSEKAFEAMKAEPAYKEKAPFFATFGNLIRNELTNSMEQIFIDVNRYIFETVIKFLKRYRH